MKLHLPTSLRSALLACLAAVAPIATTVATSSMIAGSFVYSTLAPQAQAENSSYYFTCSLSTGKFLNQSNAIWGPVGSVNGDYATPASGDWWGGSTETTTKNNILVFISAEDFFAATGEELGTGTQVACYDASTFSLGGVTVLAGATGYSMNTGALNSNRCAFLNADDTEDADSRATFTIGEDFSMINGSTHSDASALDLYLNASVDIIVAADKTFTMQGYTMQVGAAEEATVYIQGEGTFAYDITSVSDDKAAGTANDWDIATGATFDLSANASERLELAIGSGSVILNGGTLKLAGSATLTSTVVLTANGGTIQSTNNTLTLAGDLCLGADDLSLDLTGQMVTLASGFNVVLDGGALAGTYDILECFGLVYLTGDLSVEGLSASQEAIWEHDKTTGILTLTIAGIPSSDITWEGGSGNWTDANWTNDDSGATDTTFLAGDAVSIGTTTEEAGEYTIAIDADLIVKSLTFKGAASYTLDAGDYTISSTLGIYAMGTGDTVIYGDIAAAQTIYLYGMSSTEGSSLTIYGDVAGDMDSISATGLYAGAEADLVITGDITADVGEISVGSYSSLTINGDLTGDVTLISTTGLTEDGIVYLTIDGDVTGVVGDMELGAYSEVVINGNVTNVTTDIVVGSSDGYASSLLIDGSLTIGDDLLTYANTNVTITGDFNGDTDLSYIDSYGDVTIGGTITSAYCVYVREGSTVTMTGGIQDASAPIYLEGGTAIIGADSEIYRLMVTASSDDGNIFSIGEGITVTVNGGNDSDTAVYERRHSYGYTVEVGAGSLVDDNVSMWMSDGAVNVIGGGTYIVDNVIIGSSQTFTDNVTLTVGAGTTMVVKGTETSTAATSSFIMGGGMGVIAIADVYGTLELNSGIGVCSGSIASANLNVYEGASLIMNAGLLGASSTTSSDIQINIAGGASLLIGDDATATNYNDHLDVNMADGSTLKSNGVAEVTNSYTTLIVADGANVSVIAQEGETLNLYGGSSCAGESGQLTLSGGGTVGMGSSGAANTTTVYVSSGMTIDYSINANVDAEAEAGAADENLALAMGAGVLKLESATAKFADAATITGAIMALDSNSSICTVTAGASITLNGAMVMLDGSTINSIGMSESTVAMGENFLVGYVDGVASDDYLILTDIGSIDISALSAANVLGVSERQDVEWLYDAEAGTLTLSITGQTVMDLVWGGGSGDWHGDNEWVSSDGTETFANGDTVTIGTAEDAAGAGNTINVDGNIVVNHLNFEGASNWTLSDAGSTEEVFSINGTITMNGTGTVSVDANCPSIATLVVNSGSLSFDCGVDTLGSVTIDGGNLTFGTNVKEIVTTTTETDEDGNETEIEVITEVPYSILTAENITVSSGSLTAAGDINTISKLLIQGGTTSLCEGTYTVDEEEVSNNIYKIGAVTVQDGTLTVGHASYIGPVTIEGGTFNIGYTYYLDDEVNVSGGELNIGYLRNCTSPINITGGVVNIDEAFYAFYLYASGTGELNIGDLGSGYRITASDDALVHVTGDITAYGGNNFAVTVSGNASMTLDNSASYLSGVTVTGGNLYLGDRTVTEVDEETGVETTSDAVVTIATVSQNGGTITFGGDTEITSFNVTTAAGTMNIVLEDGVTVTNNGGASSDTSTQIDRYQYSADYGVNIVVGEGAVYSDNVKWWTKGGTFGISGGGTVQLTSLLLDCSSTSTTMTIGAGTTLEILSSGPGTTTGFGLSGAGDAYSVTNVNGTLITNGLVYSYGTSTNSTVNISSTGTWQLNDGLCISGSNLAALVNVDGTLAVGNQANTTDYASWINVTMNDGSTFMDNGEEEVTTTYNTLVYSDNADVTFATSSDTQTLVMASAVSGTNISATIAGGGTVELAGGATLASAEITEGSTLLLSAADTAVGSITITDGTLLTTADTSTLTSVSVGAAGTLNASSGMTITDSLALADGSTIILTSGSDGIDITAATFSAAEDATLTIGFDTDLSVAVTEVILSGVSVDQLSDLGLTLLDEDEDIYGVLANTVLATDGSWELTDKYYLYVDGDELILSNQVDFVKVIWAGGEDGVWSTGGAGWYDGGVFASEISVLFDERGEATPNVTVDAAGVTVNKFTVSNADYSFTGGQITVLMGIVVNEEATASFSNNVVLGSATSITVETGSSLSFTGNTDAILVAALTNEGSISSNVALTVDSNVTAGGTLDVAALTVNGNAVITSLTSAGNVGIDGALSLVSADITGTLTTGGDLSLGTGTITGALTAGDTTLTGDVSIGSGSISGDLSNATSLTVTSGSLMVTGDLANAGTIDATGYSVNLTGTISAGGTLYANNVMLGSDASFTLLTATGSVTNSGTLTMGDGSSITGTLSAAYDAELNPIVGSLVTAGDVSVGAVDSNGLVNLSNGTGTLTLGSGVAVSGTFSNEGTLSMVGQDLTLSSGTTAGGTVTAGSLSMGADSSFTKLTTAGDVTSASTLTLGDGSVIGGSLSGGSLVSAGTVKLGGAGSLTNLTNSGTLTISSDVTVTGTFNNYDSTLNMVGYDLSLSSACNSGGTVSVADLALGGDGYFTALTATGTVTSTGTLSVSGDSDSIGTLTGGGSLMNSGDLTITSIVGDLTRLSNSTGTMRLSSGMTVTTYFANEGTIDMTGYDLTLGVSAGEYGGTVLANNLSLAGSDSFTNLTLTGDITTTGSLSITGVLSTGSSLSITLDYQMNTSNTSVVSIADLQMGTDGTLDLVVDNDYLVGLNMVDGESYVIATVDSATNLDTILLNSLDTYFMTNGGEMSISYDESTGDITLALSIDASEWILAGDGSWGANGWSTADDENPDGSIAIVAFSGNNTGEVYVDGDKYVLSMSVNDATVDGEGYTFVNDDINTSNLAITQGDATIANTTTVTGATNMGSSSASVAAVLTVAEDGVFSTTSLNMSQDDSVLKVLGTASVTGALTSATGATITNSGTLTIGTGSAVDSIVMVEGSVLNVSAGTEDDFTTVTIDSLTGTGTLNALDYSNVTIDVWESTVTIVASELAKVSIAGFSEGGSLDVGEGEVDITDASELESLVVGDGATVTIAGDSSLSGLDNDGQLNVDGTLSLTSTTSNGGNINADELVVTTASVGSLVTDSIILESIEYVDTTPTVMMLMSAAYTLDADANANYVLSVDDLTSKTPDGLIELSLNALTTSTDDGNYYLIENTGDGDGYSWDMFALSDATSDVVSELITEVGKDVLFATTDNGDLVLVIETADERTWYTHNNYAVTPEYDGDSSLTIEPIYDETTGALVSYSVLDTVQSVNVSADVDISLDGVNDSSGNTVVTINNLTGYEGKTLTIEGDSAGVASVTLSNDSTTYAASKLVANNLIMNVESETQDITLSNGQTASVTGYLTLAELELNNSDLSVEQDANFTVISLTMDDESTLSGDLTLSKGSSTLSGSYSDATLNLVSGASATVDVASATGLSLTGTSGTYTLTNASDGTIGSIATTGANIDLGTVTSSLNLVEDSTMVGGSLSFAVSTSDVVAGTTATLTTGSLLTLTDTDIVISQSDTETKVLSVTGTSDVVLAQINDSTRSSVTGDYEFIFEGAAFEKYFSDAYVNSEGFIVATRNDSAYNGMAQTENGAAGLNLVSKVLWKYNPEANTIDEDMDKVLADMDTYKAAGNYAAADALAAAVAGSSTTSLGSAAVSDVERQLRSIRNRTKMMGVDPSVVNEDMPYFNGWIAAEGGSSTLDADGTNAGHKLNNFGGSVGVDVDLNDMVSVGASFTALYGDLTGDGPDTAEGDFNTMYGSLFARINNKRWTHSFVATFGAIDATLDRTVSTTSGPYKTKGETDGTAFGLMYEVGYTYALTEDASTCLQPLFNVALVNSSIGGYTETGSDAALEVGDQDNNYVTFGLGGLLETVVGENVYNRASVLSARAMMKFDAGDRTSEADVTLLGTTETVKGAEVGAVGVELGLGITIPVTEEVGAIFMDVSCEFRSGYTNVNGSVGYRFSF